MQLTILKDEGDCKTVQVDFEKEGHTLGNLIRDVLANNNDVFAPTYTTDDDERTLSVQFVTTNSADPREVFRAALSTIHETALSIAKQL